MTQRWFWGQVCNLAWLRTIYYRLNPPGGKSNIFVKNLKLKECHNDSLMTTQGFSLKKCIPTNFKASGAKYWLKACHLRIGFNITESRICNNISFTGRALALARSYAHRGARLFTGRLCKLKFQHAMYLVSNCMNLCPGEYVIKAACQQRFLEVVTVVGKKEGHVLFLRCFRLFFKIARLVLKTAFYMWNQVLCLINVHVRIFFRDFF